MFVEDEAPLLCLLLYLLLLLLLLVLLFLLLLALLLLLLFLCYSLILYPFILHLSPPTPFATPGLPGPPTHPTPPTPVELRHFKGQKPKITPDFFILIFFSTALPEAFHLHNKVQESCLSDIVQLSYISVPQYRMSAVALC